MKLVCSPTATTQLGAVQKIAIPAFSQAINNPGIPFRREICPAKINRKFSGTVFLGTMLQNSKSTPYGAKARVLFGRNVWMVFETKPARNHDQIREFHPERWKAGAHMTIR